jgi:hypothetical protein
MCIMLTDSEPSSTRLINVPIVMNDIKYKLLIYTNDIESSANNLMIVPIPNIFSCDDFGLLDISTNEMKKFRNQLIDYCMIDNDADFDSDNDGPMIKGANRIKVHKIGNYTISIAPDLDSLETMIDWDKFNKPIDFVHRKKTLYDANLYPFKCAYVIAQAHHLIKNDGFGVIYPDPGFVYFPTAHENTKTIHTYDVMCYNCFDSIYDPRAKIKLIDRNITSYNKNESAQINDIFSHLEHSVTMSKNGSMNRFELNIKYKNINYFEIDGKHPNQNIIC